MLIGNNIKYMKLSGGNYGGYTLVNDEVVLYDEVDNIVDTQSVITNGTNMVINGWIYNQEGIFSGTE